MTGVRASAVILAEDGREVTTTEREAGDAQSAWSGGRWPFVLRIPAGALVPGMYRARFEVSGPAVSGTSSSTIREVVFRIAERTP